MLNFLKIFNLNGLTNSKSEVKQKSILKKNSESHNHLAKKLQ